MKKIKRTLSFLCLRVSMLLFFPQYLKLRLVKRCGHIDSNVSFDSIALERITICGDVPAKFKKKHTL